MGKCSVLSVTEYARKETISEWRCIRMNYDKIVHFIHDDIKYKLFGNETRTGIPFFQDGTVDGPGKGFTNAAWNKFVLALYVPLKIWMDEVGDAIAYYPFEEPDSENFVEVQKFNGLTEEETVW